MTSKISPSSVGESERVSDSVQPVHSCIDNQISDGRFAASSAAATRGIMLGGNAISDVVAAQNFKKLRRDTPRRARASPRVSIRAIVRHSPCALTCCSRSPNSATPRSMSASCDSRIAGIFVISM